MIRKARFEDISRIAEILIFTKRASYRNIFNNDKVSFGEMQVLPLAQKLKANTDLLNSYYVYDDDFVKAVMRITVSKCNIEINELYIDYFFIGQGIGSLLIDFVKTLDASIIILWVLEKNILARKFYESKGFINSGDKKLEEGTTEFILKYYKKNESQ